MRHSSYLYLLAVAVLLTGCRRDTPSTAATGGATVVDVVEVVIRDIDRRIELPGASVRGYESANLMAKVGGYVDAVYVDIGSEVKQDDVLAKLSAPEMVLETTRQETLVRQAEANLQTSRAEVELAKAQLGHDEALRQLRQTESDRMANLVESGALKQQKLDEARFALQAALAAVAKTRAQQVAAEAQVQSAQARIEVARATLAKSQAMLDYATIRAPFDGLINRRHVDRGAFVQPATSNSSASPLFSIVRVDKLRVVVSVPMTETPQISVGQAATFGNIGGLPGESVQGTISRVAVALEQDSRMMRAEIDLPNPPDPKTGRRKLTPGMFGTVSLVVETFPATPTVPASALGSDAQGHYVMTIQSDKCVRQPVKVLFNDAIHAGLSGISNGTLVVTRDVARLKDNQPVTVRR